MSSVVEISLTHPLTHLTHLTHSTDSLVTEGNKFREIDKSAPQQNGIRVIDLVV